MEESWPPACRPDQGVGSGVGAASTPTPYALIVETKSHKGVALSIWPKQEAAV